MMENKILVELDEDTRLRFNEVSEINFTDYELKGNTIPVDSLISMVEDMLAMYHNKEEELEDTIRDRDDNWRPIPYEEQI